MHTASRPKTTAKEERIPHRRTCASTRRPSMFPRKKARIGKPRCSTEAQSSRPSATPVVILLPLIKEAPNCCRTRKPIASLKAATQARINAAQLCSRARAVAESEGGVVLCCITPPVDRRQLRSAHDCGSRMTLPQHLDDDGGVLLDNWPLCL